MEKPTPPEAPRSFKLPLGAWLAWGFYAVAMLVFFFLTDDPARAEGLGGVLGRIVAELIFPVLVAWIVWRLFGRSAKAGVVAFFVVFLLSLVGQLVQVTRQVQVAAETVRLANQNQGAQLQQSVPLAQSRSAAAVEGPLSDQARATRARLIDEAGKAYVAKFVATKERYEATVKNLDVRDFWRLPQLDDPKVLAQRRRAVQAFADANDQLDGMQNEGGGALQAELDARGIPAADAKKVIAGYRQQGAGRLSLVRKIRTADAQIAQAMLDFLDFAETSHGKWRVEATTGKTIFIDEKTRAVFDEIVARVKTASAEQAAAQQQLLVKKS